MHSVVGNYAASKEALNAAQSSDLPEEAGFMDTESTVIPDIVVGTFM